MTPPGLRKRGAPPPSLVSVASDALAGSAPAWIFTLLLAAAAIAVFVVLVAPMPAYEALDQAAWPLFVLAFGLAEMIVVRLVVRGQTVLVTFQEIPLVLGFYLIAPGMLIATQFVGTGLVLVVHRRRAPLKVAFTLAALSLGSSLGVLVFQAIARSAPENVIDWLVGSFGGSATMVAVGAAAAWALIAISLRRLELAALVRAIAFGLTTAFVNTSIALLAIVDLKEDVGEFILLAVPAALGLVGYRAFGAQREREIAPASTSTTAPGSSMDRPSTRRPLVSLLLRTRQMFGPTPWRSSSRACRTTRARPAWPSTRRAGRGWRRPAGTRSRAAERRSGRAAKAASSERSSSGIWPPAEAAAGMIVPLRGAGDIIGTHRRGRPPRRRSRLYQGRPCASSSRSGRDWASSPRMPVSPRA